MKSLDSLPNYSPEDNDRTINQETLLGRRGFLLKVLMGLGGIITLGMIIQWLFTFRSSRGKKDTALLIFQKDLRKLGDGFFVTDELEKAGILLVATADGLAALSLKCPHLGCLVRLKAEERQFECPCHASLFGKDGGYLKGPAGAPLRRYRVSKVGNGEIRVEPDQIITDRSKDWNRSTLPGWKEEGS